MRHWLNNLKRPNTPSTNRVAHKPPESAVVGHRARLESVRPPSKEACPVAQFTMFFRITEKLSDGSTRSIEATAFVSTQPTLRVKSQHILPVGSYLCALV